MPELKALPPGAVKGFTAAPVDLETIKYCDKVREKARLIRLTAKKEERVAAAEGQGAKVKTAPGTTAVKAAHRDDDDDDDDDEEEDGSDGDDSSNDGDSDGGSSASSGSSENAKPNAAKKRLRKGRKKVLSPPVHSLRHFLSSNALQGSEGAWSIKKAKLASKRKRKVSRRSLCPSQLKTHLTLDLRRRGLPSSSGRGARLSWWRRHGEAVLRRFIGGLMTHGNKDDRSTRIRKIYYLLSIVFNYNAKI
jgi:hypothetical protein